MRSESLTTFWALCDPVRLEILDRIAGGTEVTATQLATVMPMTRQALSRHLATLEEAGLVVGEKEGREHRYRVEPAPVETAGRWLTARSASWGRALTRLADYVESSGDGPGPGSDT